MNGRQEGFPAKGQIRSSIRMLIPLRRQSEALEILGAVRAQVRSEPGCINSRLYRGVNEVRAVMVEELWANHEEFFCHLQSDAYRWVLLAMEMAEEPPEIRFETIEGASGIETIEHARGPG